MKAKELYDRLEKDFIKGKGLSDDWKELNSSKYTSPNYKKRNMGVVYDFSKDIKKVYTAVFPEKKVIKKILLKKEKDILLFVHHPMAWDITKKPIFRAIPDKDLKIMKTRRIAVYNLHVPLDNYSKYSTSKTLADVLGIKVEKKFAPYFGSMCGVIGTIDLDKTSKVKKRFEKVLGHKSMLYKYGTDKINKHKVTIVAGGGNNLEILQEIPKDCNLHITGITKKNSYSQKSYDYAKKRKLNILGGTHYSTEKFACISMVEYFKKQGLPCKFISGKPVMEDI